MFLCPTVPHTAFLLSNSFCKWHHSLSLDHANELQPSGTINFSYINDFHSRKIVTKFRCSDHTLEIERGRHKNVDLEKRTCRICNRDIESEKHFLQVCPCYFSIRKKYFGGYNNNFYLHILQSKTKIDAFNLSNYLTKALKLRNEILSLPCMTPATITSLPCCCL